MWPFKKRAIKSTVGHPLSGDKDLLRLFRAYDGTGSGVYITQDNAMQIETVFACVRLISETIATLPLCLYERKSDDTIEKATGHPLYTLLHDAPNEGMTSAEFRETLQAQLELYGNAYVEIVRDNASRPIALWPIPPRAVRVEVEGYVPTYYVRTTDGERRIQQNERRIMHLRFMPGSDGVMGIDPITAMREGLGLTLAAREFGSSFFGNGASAGGILTHPATLGEKARLNIAQSFNDQHAGPSNANRLMVLEEGMTYSALGVPPDNAQFLETRKFQTAEIAGRIFRVPLHMIGDLDKATFNNIEEMGIDFSRHTIRPRTVRNEQAYNKYLLSDSERGRFFFEHNLDGLLRGNIQTRYSAYQTGIMAGFLSRNEVRRMENLNPVDGLEEFLVQPGMANGQTQMTDDTEPATDDDPTVRALVDQVIAALPTNGKHG